ncbi:SH3 domain-binding protein 1-like isoform X2 [Tribolium madens]|uniref:SH3 domain-binding protein 1-like isoform X2 n=1 Tax=Tribolium madens TaxID=41895 RepID=UPI001CF72EEB|nr:SH3 domain-binding protein 1-like isoform X2 [Tribolium madens]
MKKQFFRVKQLADQTFLRADKSEVLNNEELQVADQKIEYLRTALSAIIKRIPHSGQNNDIDKRKKSIEHHLASVFFEQSTRKNEQGDLQELPNVLFCATLKKCAMAEQDLAREYADHEKQVEDLVSAPIQLLLDSDFHNILKQKRNLSKYILDKDSASNRYHATKKEALRDDMEEADYKVEQSRDALAYEMFSLLAKENDLAGYMLQILKCQRAYHDSALKHLESVIPELEKQIGDSSVKRVYGIPLQDHLRVTNKKIALPLEICITLLQKHGLHEEGLFRIAGSMSRVKRLKSSIDSGCFSPKLIPEYQDMHVLASALKMYLRELPDPLLTSKLYNEWLQSMQKPESERLDIVKGLIASLPRENRDNLAFLIQFLSELSRHPQNKMSSSNIAIVVAPNLLWDKEEAMNMGNCAASSMLVELFIKEVHTLFPEDVSKFVTFSWFDDEGGFTRSTIDLNASTENISVSESPKPSSRKKKTPAPGPPNNFARTDQDLVQNEKNSMSSSYPSGSSTLNRPQKPRENPKPKTSIGVNTDDRKMSLSQEETHKPEVIKPPPLVNLDSSKTVAHKVITEPATPVQVSKAKPVQPVVAQNACDNKNFKTTITHSLVQDGVCQKPIAAPRSIDTGVKRSSSIKIDLKQPEIAEVTLRRPEIIAAKPEVPARPASLTKRPSMDLDPTLHRTQCSVYSLANKQQPSYVNVQNRNEKFQPGHDNKIAEKERFLGHQPLKFDDINSNSKTGLPPKAIKGQEKSDASKSNEDLGDLGEKLNGNQKTSHVRTRSDGNLIELSESLAQTPPSPRSLNKPTQPPPPPPVSVKKEPDSTDL